MQPSFQLSLEEFKQEIERLVKRDAASKGYVGTRLFDSLPGVPTHALGEIIYKAHRYAARQQLDDIYKIAAWAYMVADWHRRTQGVDQVDRRPVATSHCLKCGNLITSNSGICYCEGLMLGEHK